MSRPKKFESNKEYKKWWNEQNKERVAEYKKQYYKDNKETLRVGSRDRKRLNRAWAVEQLGGKCVDCGVTDNLEFDHIYPSTKDKKICEYISVRDKLEEEIKKCELRCKSCHRERSNKQLHLSWALFRNLPPHLQDQWMENSPTPEQIQTLFGTIQ